MAIEKLDGGGIAITGAASMQLFRLIVIEQGLKLETYGLKRRGRSCYAIARKELGLTGSRASVLVQLRKIINEWKEAGEQ